MVNCYFQDLCTPLDRILQSSITVLDILHYYARRVLTTLVTAHHLLTLMYNMSFSYLVPVLLEAGLALGREVPGVVHHLQLPEDAPAGQDVHDVRVQALDLLNQDRRSENYN